MYKDFKNHEYGSRKNFFYKIKSFKVCKLMNYTYLRSTILKKYVMK